MSTSARLRARDVPVGKLHANPANPRTISDERLKALMRSIESEPGMLDARPVVALRDGTIIAGNMRWRACRELGRPTIPAVTVDLDDERAKLWLLRDNNEYGEWEDDQLAGLLAELQAADVDLDLSGFGSDAIDALLASLQPDAGRDTEPGPCPVEPRSKLGDLYVLGDHRLLCGDSTVVADVERLMDGQRASLMVTDPPYGVIFGSAKKNAISGDLSQALIPISFAVAVDQVLDDDARLYVCGGSGNFTMYAKLFDYHLQQNPHLIVWVKESFVMRSNNYHSQFEFIYFGLERLWRRLGLLVWRPEVLGRVADPPGSRGRSSDAEAGGVVRDGDSQQCGRRRPRLRAIRRIGLDADCLREPRPRLLRLRGRPRLLRRDRRSLGAPYWPEGNEGEAMTDRKHDSEDGIQEKRGRGRGRRYTGKAWVKHRGNTVKLAPAQDSVARHRASAGVRS